MFVMKCGRTTRKILKSIFWTVYMVISFPVFISQLISTDVRQTKEIPVREYLPMWLVGLIPACVILGIIGIGIVAIIIALCKLFSCWEYAVLTITIPSLLVAIGIGVRWIMIKLDEISEKFDD